MLRHNPFRAGKATALVTLGILSASCSSNATGGDAGSTTGYGAPVAVGNGTAQSYLVMQNGEPAELGVVLTQGALDSLPATPKMGGYEYLVPLPADNPTQYQVIGLNWNPTGHPPPMVYTVPHFDFHFYMISPAERTAIDPSDPAFATEAADLPAADFRVTGYVADQPANAIPHMGLHWTDSNAPEFHGEAFTRTFIMGSWDGRFTFLEPMVTRAYLLTLPHDSIAVDRASQRAIAGYYPGAYRVSWDAAKAQWRIGLAGLAR